jgi:D-alanine--poly(phosphoribitol) ligase subunit 2
MEIKNNILNILEEITGTDEVRKDLDLDLFTEGLLDSIGSVQLLLDMETYCKIRISPLEFDREQWATPRKIIEQAERRMS